MSKETIAPSSHNLVKATNIIRTDTHAVPTTITSMATRILDTSGVEVEASNSGSAVTGESGTWSAEFDNTESASVSDGTEYYIEVTVVADSKTRIKRKLVKAVA